MKVIFLDIDGVIATDNSFRSKKFLIDKVQMPYKWDEKCVESLKHILEQTQANIVLTSDWRLYYPLEEMKTIFKYYGLPSDKLIDYTLNFRKLSSYNYEGIRCSEIEKYLLESKHDIDNWVAVDDMNLSELSNFVHVVDTWVGIAYYEQEIINKLK
jgi:hypothetical protein